jgi:hypothetical protein
MQHEDRPVRQQFSQLQQNKNYMIRSPSQLDCSMACSKTSVPRKTWILVAALRSDISSVMLNGSAGAQQQAARFSACSAA